MDFQLSNHGSFYLLKPMSEEAEEWVAEHIPDDALWWCGAVAVEPRYVAPIVIGIQDDGMSVN